MPLLGYDLPPEEIDKVFNEYDPGTPASIIHTYQCPAPRLLTLAIPLLCACADGSGTLDFQELQRMLRPRAPPGQAANKLRGAKDALKINVSLEFGPSL